MRYRNGHARHLPCFYPGSSSRLGGGFRHRSRLELRRCGWRHRQFFCRLAWHWRWWHRQGLRGGLRCAGALRNRFGNHFNRNRLWRRWRQVQPPRHYQQHRQGEMRQPRHHRETPGPACLPRFFNPQPVARAGVQGKSGHGGGRSPKNAGESRAGGFGNGQITSPAHLHASPWLLAPREL